jgi:hypothetical protein
MAARRVILALAVALWPAAVHADRAPEPPCGRGVWPPPAALDAAPAVATALRGDGAARWQPPACSGWQGDDFRVLVAVAGRFRLAGDADALLARFGAVSRLVGMSTWSVSSARWQPLVTASHALDGPRGAPRPDFAPEELRGAPRFVSETGSFTSGPVTYRMAVREATSDRLVVTVENITVMRRLLIDLFDPGELQSLYVLEREADDVWTYYALTRTRAGANPLTEGHEASYVNRGLALFQHYAADAGAAPPPVAWWR